MLKLLIKIGVSLLLLAGLTHFINLGNVLERLKNINMLWVALACFFLMGGQVLSATRWALLAKGLGLTVRISRKIRLYFLGMFLSLFLPSIVGGDVARGYLLARGREGSGWAAAASIILERVNGVVGLTVITTLCMLGLDLPQQWWIGWLGVVAVLWTGMLTYSFWHQRLPRFMKHWQSLPIDQSVFHRAWWKFNGFGIREAGYVGFAAYFGGNTEAAAVMAALWVIVLAVAALPGAWVLWRLGGSAAIKRQT